MTYKVYKKGIGCIYGHLEEELVASFYSWKQAHDKVMALQETTRNFYFFIKCGF